MAQEIRKDGQTSDNQGRILTVQCDDIIEEVAKCIGNRWKKRQIKDHLSEILGKPVAHPTYEAIASKARALMRERMQRNPAVYRYEAVEFYQNIIADPRASLKYKLKAQSQLELIMGVQVSITDTGTPEKKAAELREALQQMEESVVSEAEEKEEQHG